MNKIDEIKVDIAKGIEVNAMEYFKLGIGMFYEYYNYEYKNEYIDRLQTTIGILGISIELMLKSLIAKESFILLYKALPKESILKLNYPQKIKQDKFVNEIELKQFKNKFTSIEFQEAIGIFYNFCDKKNRREFKSYFKDIRELRNSAVHTYIPEFEKYYLDKFAYVSLKLFKFLLDEYELFKNIEKSIDKSYLEKYEENLFNKFKKKIENAQENCTDNEIKNNNELARSDWYEYIVKCPVCKSKAKLDGYTELEELKDSVSLFFIGDSFKCDCCGLKLNDIKEIEFAKMNNVYDITEQLDDWMMDQQAQAEEDGRVEMLEALAEYHLH